jgi:hypothetical protein
MAQVASARVAYPEQPEQLEEPRTASTAGLLVFTQSWETPAEEPIEEVEERLLAFFEARLEELPEDKREQRIAEISAIEVRGGTART